MAQADTTIDAKKAARCPVQSYDCRAERIRESSLSEHYRSEVHQRAMAKCVRRLMRSAHSSLQKADEEIMDTHDPTSPTDQKLLSIADNLNETKHHLEALSTSSVKQSFYLSNLPTQLHEIQQAQALETSFIEAKRLNGNVLRHQIANAKEQLANRHGIDTEEFDGIFVWKIDRVAEKLYDAKSERQTSIYSRDYYTSPSGYKFCIRLYLNGDGTTQGVYASIFIVILRGPFDAVITWPFPGRVCFCLCDQRTVIESNGTKAPKHVIDCFRPDITSVSFKRPTTAVNIASGIPKFVLLSELERPSGENLYVVDDTMYIKAFIDFSNTARAMLPFICNVNLALPAHVRWKLIEEEARRQEQAKSDC